LPKENIRTGFLILIIGSIWNPELEVIFEKKTGRKIFSCDLLSSHGSDRIILRLISDNGESAIGIINKHIKENAAFIGFTNHFRKHSLNVPELYGYSEDSECYLIEDLGDITLFSMLTHTHPGKRWEDEKLFNMYNLAISELPKFQIKAGRGIDFSLCYQFDEFGTYNIEYDLNYFRDMFLRKFHNGFSREKLDHEFSELKTIILSVPAEYFLYRDFQSRNIMIKNSTPHFIDYQSGRRGALQYDLASILYDAKADIPQNLREIFLEHYLDETMKLETIDRNDFKTTFWYFAVIRILQALGAYGYLGIVKNKHKFLESIPYGLKNLKFILSERIDNTHLNYLKDIISKLERDAAFS
jgi:aminoglycoside/choline kinase family phosphotransferase